MSDARDPNLLQDFLTEAGELVEQLDTDLIKLEAEPESQPLLDQIFRALHTIKGAASFLDMSSVTTFAHAAEDALNKLRKGEIKVDQRVMDAMLKSVDVIRGQLGELGDGAEPSNGPDELIHQLHAIAGSIPESMRPPVPMPARSPASTSAPMSVQPAPLPRDPPCGVPAPAPNMPAFREEDLPALAGAEPLSLSPEKADVLSFMVSDLLDSTRQIDAAALELKNSATRVSGAAKLRELADAMQPTADYYGFAYLGRLIGLVAAAGAAMGTAPDAPAAEASVRLRALRMLIAAYADGLTQGKMLAWPLDTFEQRFGDAACGQAFNSDIANAHADHPARALMLDGVIPSAPGTADVQAPLQADTTAPLAESALNPADFAAAGEQPGEAESKAPAAEKSSVDDSSPEKAAGAGHAGGAEQTVRVEVSRLETLLNLVGEMVLTKNQILGQSRVLREHNLPHEVMESFASVVGDLDRLTAELQMGVMRTRMQPLGKLFGRYPRIVRDLSRKTGKQVALEITGGDTEVDKSVLELLGDPLVHMIRNSVDHGLETPEVRTGNGKSPGGTVRLSAEHRGGHVCVTIADDGRGIDREKVAAKAVEKGMVSADAVASMPDSDVFRFIFAAGLSTAEQVSDLSGRGVGMDVVQTNIAKLGGTINIASAKGKGTTIEITIPLTVAILRAMMVGVGAHEYAVPVMNIHEIVKPENKQMHSVAGRPVLRLRESVLPLVDLRRTLGEPMDKSSSGFAVVVGVGAERAGLVVDRLVGQSEVVIKPLDDGYTQGGPFSGATIREDGNVSLILDVVKLVRSNQGSVSEAA
ncbi:MAG: chemotaxis protein CheW [Phycisphaerales bacterium]